MAPNSYLFAWLVVAVSMLIMDTTADKDYWSLLRLPEEHMPYIFHNNKQMREMCASDNDCPYKEHINSKLCWGYEKKCPEKNRMVNPVCPGGLPGHWVKSKEDQLDQFWKEGDFGYIKERLEEMKVVCQPQDPGDSYFACAKYTRYCRATNIYMDFSNLLVNDKRDRYKEDVFKKGQIGGHCKFDQSLLESLGEHKSPLQSWYAEVENYSSLPFKPLESGKCDITFEKPVIFMKLDSGVNMFHHFCDYINLYASMHINGSFSMDTQIVMWDTSEMHYGDFFHDTWKAFTNHPVIPLKDFHGKKVCFKDTVFPLLPRMRRGLYYNMPLMRGCKDTGLFRAFNQFVLHRLNITQRGPLEKKIRVTLLSRSTKYRTITNQEELVNAMKTVGDLEVKVVDYRHLPFLEQLEVTYNSDVFMGMHGAGLTHLLFQPDWGVIFEIYNCEDEHCYNDLSRLRGLNYMTWEKKEKLDQEDEGHHPTLGAHAKFTNYGFDVHEFLRMVRKGADYVKNHPSYKKEMKRLYGIEPDKDEL